MTSPPIEMGTADRQQQEKPKRSGTAVIEFLDPIPPGLPKDEFIARLTEAVEARTAELVAEATGEPMRRATLIPDPPNGMEAKPTADNLAAYEKA